jgi:hypothetical protein
MKKRSYRIAFFILSILILTGLAIKIDVYDFPFAHSNEALVFTETHVTRASSPTTSSPTVSTPIYTVLEASFYVSRIGSNADGKSWETAWNELDQIQWEKVQAGDVILIAEGEYHTNMVVGQSGQPGRPIIISTNGAQVILDGQRPDPPYCGEQGFVPVKGHSAISLEDQKFIVIDGLDWSGIVIRNYARGILMNKQTNNIVVRNVELYDNGWSVEKGNVIYPDGPGVELGGSDILFERVLIHDNGQDAFQAGWGVWKFTLRTSWLYNSREHPVERGKSFNYCSHTDGIQIYDGGLQGPITIENSIIGPSFSQGVMINNKATVNNVLITNTLFVGNVNAGIAISNGGNSSDWTLQNVTIVQNPVSEGWSLKMNGNGHQIRDSIFWGGPWGIGIYDWSVATGNYRWLTQDQYGVTTEMDPRFLDGEYRLFAGDDFADFDFEVQNSLIPSETGSAIVSVHQLFDQ